MRPQAGDIIRSKYRIIRLIGDGGIGSVFEAKHEMLGTPVALKFLHPELAKRAGLVSRFLQEARVSASIQSPHVTRVTDVDQTEEGAAFIVMELLSGEPLQNILDRDQKMPRDRAIDFALQMLSGREAVWLPKFLLSKSLTADQFRKLAEKMLPRLQWLEGRVRPRYWPFGNSRMAERTIGLVALILGTVVTLPIPFGNWFPALACALFGLALAERDGLVLVAAGVAVIIAITMLGVVFGTAGVMASMVFS